MTIFTNNLLSANWHCMSIILRQQPAYTHAVPANFASDKEREGQPLLIIYISPISKATIERQLPFFMDTNKMNKFEIQLNRAAEIREFYILAAENGFTEGNPEVEGYTPE